MHVLVIVMFVPLGLLSWTEIKLLVYRFVKSLPVLFITLVIGWSYYAYVVGVVVNAMEGRFVGFHFPSSRFGHLLI